jgi:hypothetical protein
MLLLPVPLDTDAQGFGYLALTLRESGSLTSLAPFHPEISWLYSPGFPALVAYFSARLNTDIQVVQLAIGGALSFLFIWLAYDLGNELDEKGDRQLGQAFAAAALLGLGLFTAYMDSHFTAVLGLVFALAFITFATRFLKAEGGKRADFLAAAICLAGVPLAQPDMTIILGFGFASLLISCWLVAPRPSLARWLLLGLGVPALALLGVLPWVAEILPLLGGPIASPFEISQTHVLVMFVYHGGLIVLLTLVGIIISLRRPTSLGIAMFIWLLLCLDFSSFGLLSRLLGGLLGPILKYDYPFSIAWHGPIIPYMYFGGVALHGLVNRLRLVNVVSRLALPSLALAILVLGALVANGPALLAWSKTTPIQFFGAFSSAADVQAMRWLKQNTPADSIILNHPGPHEGEWTAVIANRDAIYFRPQPFFQNDAGVEAEWEALKAFWRNPTDPAHAALLAQYGIDYVLVPQVFGQPETLAGMVRWRPPLPEAAGYGQVTETPYLKLVQDFEGAQIYQVITGN